MNLDTRWLEDFLALAEIRHFSKAAEVRHITQPAFGRRIKALETAVGHTLVDRSTTPIGLTPTGRQFHSTARNILLQMHQGVENLDQLNAPLLNPIIIACPHSLASPTLINLIDDVTNNSQTLPFSIDILRVEVGIEALKEGNCDFLFCFELMELMQPPFKNIRLGNGQFLLVSAVDREGQPLFNLDMPTLPYLRYTSGSNSARLIEQYQPSLDVKLSGVFESSMCQMHKEMVQRGKGVAWLPDNLIQEELNSGQFIALNPDSLNIPFQVRLYRNNGTLHPDAEKWWDHLDQACQNDCQLISPWRDALLLMPN